jgi:hypothetical protein
MEMVNNMMQMLADVPPMLASAWVAWFLAGGALALWYRRATELEYAPAPAPRTTAKPKPAPRPPSGVRRDEPMPAEAAPEMLDENSHLYAPPEPVAPVAAARDKKPVVIGDPFGDLATLLDQPLAPAAAPTEAPKTPRPPADSPILSSAGSPLLRTDREPKLS